MRSWTSKRALARLSLLVMMLLGVLGGSLPAEARVVAPRAGAPPTVRQGPPERVRTTVGRGMELGVVTNTVSRARAVPDAPLFLDLVAGSGARWVREEFRWDLIEPERGRWEWDAHDHAVAALRGAGFDIIGLLAYSADWAVDDTISSSPLPPPDQEWASYVTATVVRYRDSVAVWEIWNEPDNELYWRGDAPRFAELLRDTAAIIRRLDPDATIISGGVSDVGDGLAFLEAVGAAGGLERVDGVGVHPYLSFQQLVSGAYREGGIARLRALQGRFGRPLWVTEFGFSALLGGGGTAGEAAQANGMVRQIVETAASGLDVRAMVVYDAADDGTVSGNHAQHLGLFHHDGRTPKPAFVALQTLGGALAGLRAIERVAVEQPAITRYRFDHTDGSVTDVIWTDGSPHRIALDPLGPVEVVGLTGDGRQIAPTLGQVAIEVGLAPVYVTYRPAPAGSRSIEESGHSLAGAFLDEWLYAGGLAGLGLPLSEPMKRGDVWNQYFERGRLEFDGTMRWGLTGVEIAAHYQTPAREPLPCARTREEPPRPGEPSAGGAALPPPCPDDSPALRFFPQTGHTIANGMLRYWEGHGGLPRFGLPISEEFEWGGIVIQLFERARLEYHPATDAITVGHTGAEAAELQRAAWPFWPANPLGAEPEEIYLAQTGHTLTPGAALAWARLGGAELLGYPISEAFVRDGVPTQFFERGAITWSAEGAPALALVGYEHAERQADPAVHTALAPYSCRPFGAPDGPLPRLIAGDLRPRCLPDAHYFPQTEHSLRGGFLAYWQAHGGLAQFGFPISEEFVLDGQVVQYFERARLEVSSGDVRLYPLGTDFAPR